jgi:hypothetical protein
LLIAFGCVDRVFFDIPIPTLYKIAIDGQVSNRPGPYTVNVNRAFDVESNDASKTGITARLVAIIDGKGNTETLTQVASGVYQTSPDGMSGRVGENYKVRVELNDGRIYESVPDTIRTGGTMDSAYYVVTQRHTVNGIQYLFDLYANSSAEESLDFTKTHFMWRNRSTYKALTHPENEPDDPMKGGQCYRRDDGICNYKDPCSGLRNEGDNFRKKINRVGPCTCCFCWYDQYNADVILNDKMGSANGKYNNVRVDRMPVTQWNTAYKTRVELSMQSLSQQAYEFWKGVRDQRTAVSNLFQPITGKIPGNIVQLEGRTEAAQGLFYATSISASSFYISRFDVPPNIIPPPLARDDFSCLRLAPYATVVQPSFWVE